RSNLPEIAKFTYEAVDPTYVERALETRNEDGHATVGGFNYGQGSSREHAALAPRYLGLRAVLVKDYARIHWQNLVNFGILPLTFTNEADYNLLEKDDVIVLNNIRHTILQYDPIEATIKGKDQPITLSYTLSPRQKDIIVQSGLINWVKSRKAKQ